jgi:20S proteasome subunit beta 7
MDHHPSHWGKPRSEHVDAYNTVPMYQSVPDHLTESAYGPMTRTQ